jgi:predicted amidohydrolase YtcJ
MRWSDLIKRTSCLVFTVALFGSIGWGQTSDIAALLGYPQTILYNAKIITVDDASFTSNIGTIAQAMAIRDGKILATGTSATIRSLAGPQTESIDLKGRTVVPGFLLTHNHPIDWAPAVPQIVNNVASDYMINRAIFGSPEEQYKKFPAVLAEAVKAAKGPNVWVQILLIWGIDTLADDPTVDYATKDITKEMLDRIAPNNPVLVRSREAILRQGRQVMLNQKAVDVMLAANIPDRPEIPRAAKEAAVDGFAKCCSTIYRALFPLVILKGRPDLFAELMGQDMEWWAAEGETGFGSFLYHYPTIITALRTLDRSGRLHHRVAWGWGAIPQAVQDRDFKDPFLVADLATRDGEGSDHMWYIGTGVGSGGEGSGCTTLTPRDLDDHRTGDMIPPSITKAGVGGCGTGFERGGDAWNYVKAGGRWMAGHQWGDVGIDFILTMLKQASLEGGMTPEQIRARRHVADHMNGWPRQDQIPIIKDLGMITGGSNMYIHQSQAWMKEYGEQSAEWIVPRGGLVKAGVMNGIEVDKPIEFVDQNVFIELAWPIIRTAQDGKTYAPDQKISREISLKSATIWGANYMLREKVLGSLERGKWADFLVLDRDYLTIPEAEIEKIHILMTMIDGKVVHLVPSLAKELGKQPAGPAVKYGAIESTW